MPATATEQRYLDRIEQLAGDDCRKGMALRSARCLLNHFLTYQPKPADVEAMIAEIDRALTA